MPGRSSRARSRSTAQEGQSRLLSFSVVEWRSLIGDKSVFFLNRLIMRLKWSRNLELTFKMPYSIFVF